MTPFFIGLILGITVVPALVLIGLAVWVFIVREVQ